MATITSDQHQTEFNIGIQTEFTLIAGYMLILERYIILVDMTLHDNIFEVEFRAFQDLSQSW